MKSSCPLCGDTKGKKLQKIHYGKIWNALENLFNAKFSINVCKALTPSVHTELILCDSCGLQYFSPAIPGDPDFYRQLSVALNYNLETWDFRQALSLASPKCRWLDVACGDGVLLEQLNQIGVVAQGIDINPEAASRAKKRGVLVKTTTLKIYAEQHSQSFDVVSAFQVVEHLDRVVPFVRDAVRCLKPGGLLLISVPNRQRVRMNALEPLDCPPHHLSRWSSKQLVALARLTGLHMDQLNMESAFLDDAFASFFHQLPLSRRLPKYVREYAKKLFKRVGLFGHMTHSFPGFLRLYGHSMMAVYSKLPA